MPFRKTALPARIVPARPLLVALALSALLSGCSQSERYAFSGPDPSVPEASSAAASYSSVTGDLRTFKPVEPKPWGDVNRKVAPGGSSGQ